MKFSTVVAIVAAATVGQVSAAGYALQARGLNSTTAPSPVSTVIRTDNITSYETVTVTECCEGVCSPVVTTVICTTTQICEVCEETTYTSTYVTTEEHSVITVYTPCKTVVPTTTGTVTYTACENQECTVYETYCPTIPSIPTVTVIGTCDVCESPAKTKPAKTASPAESTAVVGAGAKAQVVGALVAIAGAVAMLL